MTPTPDAFVALARSSPWRWTTLHFTHRSGLWGETEAWLRRPGELLVRDAEGRQHRVDDRAADRARATVTVRLGDGPVDVAEPAPPALPHQVTPTYRPDGLVAERPDEWTVAYDDPMWQTYSWVAMLDPFELSHHVSVRDLRADTVHGRPAWRAHLRAEEGYVARCGGNCCELLWSDVGRRCEGDDAPTPAGTVYPDGYDVALDLQTGVVVRCLPVGEHTGAPWLEVDVHEVDADLTHLFGRPTA